MGSEAATRAAGHNDLLHQSTPTCADEVDLSPRRVDQLLQHFEKELFAAGGGDVNRTRLLLSQLTMCPATQRLMQHDKVLSDKLVTTALAMLAKANETLTQLTAGVHGSRTQEDHARFEIIVQALTPDDATEGRMMRLMGELLDIQWVQIDRAQSRSATNNGCRGAFSHSTKISRRRRKDYNAAGRRLCRTYWHSDATRFDTNSRRKKRIKRLGPNKYLEHWRRVQYDTSEAMFEGFLGSGQYAAYREAAGAPISNSVFFEEKCKCVEKADHEECACPICTQMHELLSSWHRQRKDWHRNTTCMCGACAEGSTYRKASSGVKELNDFLLCEHESFPSLRISDGPHSCEKVLFRRRQCCQVPLVSSKGAKVCDSCSTCGWDKRMPDCPTENSAAAPATWKEYRPRGPTSKGHGNQEDLVEINGTRAELLQRIKHIYSLWLPHHWIKRWCEHQRHLTYATFGYDEACIMTDFSAVFDHKAWASKCCEQHHHSNMDVFVISWAREVDGKREVVTEVVRVISGVKGSAHFHNEAQKLIVDYS